MMINAENLVRSGYNVSDISLKSGTYHNGDILEIMIGSKLVGNIIKRAGISNERMLALWLTSYDRFQVYEKNDSEEQTDKKSVNVLVMDAAQSSLCPYPPEMDEDIHKLIECNGQTVGEVWTLTQVIIDHDWSKGFSKFPVHFDYFIFQNNWGGTDNWGKIDRSKVADELYLANHPWKYVWNEAGHDHKFHWLKASDRNRDIEVKMNALEEEIKTLRRSDDYIKL